MSNSRPHPALLLVLTGAAASVDAISYLGLRRVFPANMTGNTVLLAIGLAQRDYGSAIRSATALAGFVVGATVAGYTSVRSGWNRRVAGLLIGELAVLLAAAAWWGTLPTPPAGAAGYTLIAMLGAAMGAQSGTVTSLGVGVSTTYITGTWTTVSAQLGRCLRPRSQHAAPDQDASSPAVQRAVLVVYLGAALGSGYLYRFLGAGAVWAPVALLAAASLAAVPAARAGKGSPIGTARRRRSARRRDDVGERV